MDGTTKRVSESEKDYQQLEEEVRKGVEKFLVEVKARATKLEEDVLKAILWRGQRRRGGARRRSKDAPTVNAVVVVIKAEDVLVYVENYKRPLRLRRQWTLLALVLALCEKEAKDAGASDGLVPPKSQDELVALIEKQMDKKLTEEALRMNVLRLRKQLDEDELPRSLVETIKGKYRFRITLAGQIIVRNQDA